MKQISFSLKSETRTCYRFDNQEHGKDTLQTIYLKKETVREAGINPANGIKVTIEEGVYNV